MKSFSVNAYSYSHVRNVFWSTFFYKCHVFCGLGLLRALTLPIQLTRQKESSLLSSENQIFFILAMEVIKAFITRIIVESTVESFRVYVYLEFES